jgi:hypothetical protein
MFQKPNVFLFSITGLVIETRPSRVGVSPTDPVSKMLCSVVCRMPDYGQISKSPVILDIIHSQNRLESKCAKCTGCDSSHRSQSVFYYVSKL